MIVESLACPSLIRSRNCDASGGEFELVLGNALHIKNVHSRKTDVKDAAWLADLMDHGLVSGSFVPDQTTEEMCDLLRSRKQLARERTSHTQSES